MTEQELLEKVKSMLNITGDFQNETISLYIAEVKDFILKAGVDENILNCDSSVGVIARGVSDLWNFDGGKFSEAFLMRVTQLSVKGDSDVQTE